MTIATQIQDPTAGAGAPSGDPAAGEQGTQQPSGSTQAPSGQQQPAGRTYTDSDMANARRSWQREQERALTQLRQEFEQKYVPRPTPQPEDPWAAFDPDVAKTLKAVMERELETRLEQRLKPFQYLQQTTQQLAFQNEEARIKSQYPDYEKNRTAVLEFAVEHGIPNLDMAYRAWKFDELSKIDPKKIAADAVKDYTTKKTAQASTTPALEGRGGGAPPSKQPLKDYEDMDRAAAELYRQSQES